MDGPEREHFELFPIRRVDVFASVLSQLNEFVGGLEPGDRLPSERVLGDQLNASRVVLREALRALESTGKIEIRPQSGSYVIHPRGSALAAQLRLVQPMDVEFLNNLVDVRSAIEDKVVQRAGERPPGELAQLAELLERVGKEMRTERLTPGTLDLRFEAALGRIAGNVILSEVQRNIHQLWVEAFSACGMAPGSRDKMHREHVSIYDALVASDADRARHLMASHLDRIVQLDPSDSAATGATKRGRVATRPERGAMD